ncbi:MAG: hypothetical protein ACOC7R_02615 [Planctomycetota bacterium]
MIQYEQGGRFARTVRDRAGGAADSQKNRAADKITDVGGALDRAAERLDSEEDRQLVLCMHKAADTLRSVASSLAEQDLASLRDQAEDAARTRPMLFLGAAFLGGLAAARFLRSEPPWREKAEVAEPTGLEEPAETGEPVTAYAGPAQGTVIEPPTATEERAQGGPQEPL